MIVKCLKSYPLRVYSPEDKRLYPLKEGMIINLPPKMAQILVNSGFVEPWADKVTFGVSA